VMNSIEPFTSQHCAAPLGKGVTSGGMHMTGTPLNETPCAHYVDPWPFNNTQVTCPIVCTHIAGF
jgi:hypothetical protein